SEAYRLYLVGSQYSRTFTPDGQRTAISYFERALEVAPRYAPALVGIALAYYRLTQWDGIDSRVGIAKARQAAKHALEIDEELAAAHTALAAIYSSYDRRYQDAEVEFQRALQLNPNDGDAHRGYAFILQRVFGRPQEALSHMRRYAE